MLACWFRAIRQLGDPRLRGAIIGSVLIGLALHVGLILLFKLLLSVSLPTSEDWRTDAVMVGGVIMAVALPTFFYPQIVTSVFELIFAERVACAVEARWYPTKGMPRSASVTESMGVSLRLLVIGILVNTVALILYLPLLLTGLAFLLSFVINGYLVWREFFEIVALRRLAPKSANALRKQHRARVWLTGGLLAFLYTVPVVSRTLTFGTSSVSFSSALSHCSALSSAPKCTDAFVIPLSASTLVNRSSSARLCRTP